MADFARYLHIAAGSVALCSFLVPAVSVKGGRLHRRAGWVYCVAMAVVAATGGLLVADGLVRGEAVERRLFLGYVAWLSVTSVWTGIRALRTRRRTGPGGNLVDHLIPGVLAVAGALLAARGLTTGGVVEVVFGGLGVVLGGSHLRYWRTAPTGADHAREVHAGNLIGAGIGTFTAFLVVNGERLGLPGVVAWLLPTLIGVPAIALVQRRDRARRARA
jgi:hypothetical protein